MCEILIILFSHFFIGNTTEIKSGGRPIVLSAVRVLSAAPVGF